MTKLRPHPRLALFLLVLGLGLLQACYSAPDRRLLQYLNSDGFGNRYSGNAEEENWVDIFDSVSYADTFNPDVAGQSRVDIDGTIFLPEIGAVHVAGLTRTEIEALLTQKLASVYQRTDIRVQIQTTAKDYFIFGEIAGGGGVRKLTGDVTIFEAVMAANPNERKANLGRVRLIRADPRNPLVFTINVAEMMRTGDSTFNVLVQERDIIVIPPTILAQLGYFVSDLITPFTEVLNTISKALFQYNRAQVPFGNVNNNKFNIF